MITQHNLKPGTYRTYHPESFPQLSVKTTLEIAVELKDPACSAATANAHRVALLFGGRLATDTGETASSIVIHEDGSYVVF